MLGVGVRSLACGLRGACCGRVAGRLAGRCAMLNALGTARSTWSRARAKWSGLSEDAAEVDAYRLCLRTHLGRSLWECLDEDTDNEMAHGRYSQRYELASSARPARGVAQPMPTDPLLRFLRLFAAIGARRRAKPDQRPSSSQS